MNKLNYHAFRHDTIGNAWIQEPGLAIYIRRVTVPELRPRLGDFVIGSLNAKKPGKGALTAFLDRWEDIDAFSFENVMNMRLLAFLARRGYKVTNADPFEYPPSLVKLP